MSGLAPNDGTNRDWPPCATYPGLKCACRGGLQPPNKTTCTRRREYDRAAARETNEEQR